MRKLRKYFLSFALLLVLAPSMAYGASSDARQALETTINQVLKNLDDPALHDPVGRDAVLARVEDNISSLFDFVELSARSVGPSWRSFTDDEKNRFVEAFTTLLRETYLEKFDGYSGETVSYTGEVASSNGRRVEIQTTVNIQNKDVPVAYRMLNKSRWVVYDVIVEGVSLVQNFRTQFQSVLLNGSANELISIVQQKADEAREHNKKQQMSK